MIKLRDYQEEMIDGIFDKFKDGNKKVLAVGATGSGKSVTFSALAKKCHNAGMKVVLIVKRRQLVKQASQKHFTTWGIDHGVWMANHHRYAPEKQAQICSIDTLKSRDCYPFNNDDNTIVIVDEAHDKTDEIFENYPHAYIVGLTATPYSDNSNFETIVHPIENYELRDRGFLVPEKTYVPNIIDVSRVKISRGDFNQEQLAEVCSRNEVVGNIISDWKAYGENRPTILFAVNIKHSQYLCEQFNRAGIRAVHCDANTPQKERDKAIAQLVSGEIKILCNVNIFSTGVDIPEASCIIFARPTQSVIYFLQAIGRGLRIAPNKKNCIIIDNAGNTLRHGPIYLPRLVTLDKKGSGSIDAEKGITFRTCERCFFIYQSNECECPECGFVNVKKERKIKVVDGELVEFTMSDEEIEQIRVKSFIRQFYSLLGVARIRGYGQPNFWASMKCVEKFGKEFCRKYYEQIKVFNVTTLR